MDVISLTNSKAFDESLRNNTKSLVELARLGDEEAFRLIFEQHNRIIQRFVYGMVGNLALAEELTQETFLTAFRSIDSFLDERELSPWLYGIAKNITRRWMRSNQGEYFNVSLDEQNVLEVKDNINRAPDNLLLDGELNDKLHAALQALDEDKRMVFVLKIQRQLSYEEISQITGSTIPKLKTDLHRARTELRRLMNPYLEDNYGM
jgi:RNA polymerase sigma-70 factor (ECF subfamily)